tara:strand:- start:2755 stop:3699 length:945 start_codon:yes stop_codon:yes gene_type:complete
LERFRSDKILSKGLDDAVEKKFIPEVFFELAQAHDAEKILFYMQDKNIGLSNHSIYIFKKYIDYHELFLADYACKLEEHVLSKISNPVICEIGGGYGSLARMICSKHKCKYILIDLPEANLLSGYYLNEHFSNKGKKILYFSDLKKDILSQNDIEHFDIIIIPPNIEFSHDLSIDLFINTRSMMEMTKNTIQQYFHLIQNNIHNDGYFLNINRYIKKTVGEKIMISRYPYDKDWKVVLSEKAFMQEHIHFLLTQRDDSNGNIKDELLILEKESKKYFENNLSVNLRKFLNKLKNFLPVKFKQSIKSILFSTKPE